MKNGKLSKLLSTPMGVVAVVGAVVLGVELLFMALLHEFLMVQFKLSDTAWDFIDAITLTAVVAPALYFLVFRKLQESEERFRQINATALNAIVIVDEQARITDWNPAAEKIFQYRREEAVGQPLHHLIAPPRYRDDAARGFARFQETESGPLIGKVTEISALRKDGSEFPVELSLSAARLQGRWHAIGVIRDLTERKKIEERHHTLIDAISSAGIMLFLVDDTYRVRYMNQPMIEAFGDVVGKICYKGVGGVESPCSYCKLDTIINGYSKKVNYQPTTDDGRTFDIIAVPYVDTDGKVCKLEVIHDITGRKQAEEDLRLRGQLLDGTTDSVFVADFDGNFIYLNEAAWKTLGYTRGELMAMNLHALDVPEYEKLIDTRIRELLEKGHRTFESAHRRKDGSVMPIEVSARIIESGGRNLVLAAARDITERKLAEQKRLEAGDLLKDALEDAIGAIAATLEQRDPYTAGHQRRVAQLAAAIGEEMGLAREMIEGIHFGGLIHDIGKVSVPAEILGKPGRITDIEFGLIKVHAEAGYQIVKGIAFPWPVADMVRQHHERLDGSGYPQGLKGDEIVLEARILAVADVVEAMSANRPYRPGFGMDAALDEITRARGTQLDAVAVDACLRIIREKGFVFTK